MISENPSTETLIGGSLARASSDNHQQVPFKEKLSYALTNTGQTMIYGLFGMIMMFMTDYMGISSATAGIIIGAARIYDGVIDPFIGSLVDKTKTKWGKCRPYMLFTPVPVAIVAILLFAPTGFTGNAAIAYITVMYFLFSTVYSINDIPYWSMSAVISGDPKQRVSIVTMTRIIGGMGSALVTGIFWTVNKLFQENIGLEKNLSFFLAATVFCVIGACVMLQGFFNTKERAVSTAKKESFFANFKYIFKCPPLVINIVAGMLYSIIAVGISALTTYFVKWNVKELFPTMSSATVMSVFTPVIGILPAIATVIGILSVPLLIKKFEKRTLILSICTIGIVGNVISFFVGYSNLYVFMLLRFVSFLPFGVWSGLTTLMIGDSVDYVEYKYGIRLEGTCFSILTFMGNFQNSISAVIIGLLLAKFGYDGNLDPDTQQQSPHALMGIFAMVTLVAAIGFLLTMIPFIFYNLNNKDHQAMVAENSRRREEESAAHAELSPDSL